MLRSYCKYTHKNSHLLPPEASTPKKCNSAEAQDKGFKTAIMNVVKDLKEDRSKCLNKGCENTNIE